MKIVDTLTKRKLPLMGRLPLAVIIHTTGDSDVDKILKFYTSVDGYQPHYMIELDGTIHRIVPEDRVAYHAKIEDSEAHLYELGYDVWSKWAWKNNAPVRVGIEYSGYKTWKDTWLASGIHSPINLVTSAHPNFRSLGVELQQPTTPGPEIFTSDQYAALIELLQDACARNRIATNRMHLLGHYDVSPMRRCTSAGGWDPGEKFAWDRVIKTLSGTNLVT